MCVNTILSPRVLEFWSTSNLGDEPIKKHIKVNSELSWRQNRIWDSVKLLISVQRICRDEWNL